MKKRILLHAGKTKQIWSIEDFSEFLIVENKNDLTKNDNPDETQVMFGKAELATTTTCAVFQLLKDAGIPVAYEKQLSPTEFVVPKVEMILLEIIWRRYAVGSFLKRHPEFSVTNGNPPHRFHRAVFELFLKTTGGVVKNKAGYECGRLPTDLDTNKSVDDPFINNPYEGSWKLFHPKKTKWDKTADLHWHILRDAILPENVTVEMIEDLLRRVGLVLEGAWAQLGCRLIDFKIELGVTADGTLVVADVIDADSWRLRDTDWRELSKQLFRDNVDMAQIADKYALVARLVQKFRIPKQVIVVWRGSKNDPMPEIPSVPGVEIVDIAQSGHKSTKQCLVRVEEVLTAFPEGGVIIVPVGMSNGLGPVLAARTSWPVIGVPISVDEFKDDVWSSLRMPKQVPMSTVLFPENAVFKALNILAQKNPAAYAVRQLAIEKLDD